MFSSTEPGIRTVEADGKEVARASLTALPNPVLGGFRLRYLDGDHQVRRIGITPSGGSANGTLFDRNGGDNIGMRATYLSGQVYRPSSSTKACRGTCTIPVVAPPVDGTGWQLVLVGFSFANAGTGDAKVLRMSIRPAADQRSYRVELRDNGTYDYHASVSYAWVRGGQNGRVTVSGRRTANERTQAVKMDEVSAAPMFLAGFAVEFGNGDHNLRDFAIERDSDRQFYVRFNDANYDDPMNATVDLVWMY